MPSSMVTSGDGISSSFLQLESEDISSVHKTSPQSPIEESLSEDIASTSISMTDEVIDTFSKEFEDISSQIFHDSASKKPLLQSLSQDKISVTNLSDEKIAYQGI